MSIKPFKILHLLSLHPSGFKVESNIHQMSNTVINEIYSNKSEWSLFDMIVKTEVLWHEEQANMQNN